ncbi:N-acetylmuramoyl-L-alanine amidase [Acidicapsa dinghuensis]|uniref:N-acetylmuramoyl-L-alanine amidase n=1 Tax=Acidicapsa dinghuensis TaxID=2218256 RepID=A0ABW1EJX2_9BACT|nr:N-acetylmuramoyl-L-alanine amidase [Acidicapsa dinghuensis]
MPISPAMPADTGTAFCRAGSAVPMFHFPRAFRRPHSLAVVLFLASLAPASAFAQHRTHRERTVDPWEHAVQLRDKLEALPPEQRTRDRYEEVLEAFRAIYHDKPGVSKAPAAVAAVADLLAEKGRVLHDAKASRDALGQYEFLRQQYPQSPQVDNALLLEAEVCRQDLNDTGCAKEKLRQVIQEMPDTSFSEQAQLELKQMEGQRTTTHRSDRASVKRSRPESQPQVAQQPRETTPAPAPTPIPAAQDQPVESQQVDTVTHSSGKPVLITGMRHWSNPTSTRIAIDLGGKVEYEAARVPNPDRIFFDLHGARLAPGLNGKEVQVIDDGYLKRIRAAQFQQDVTRVVLDITDVSGYSAFLLPNPWRLIIDVHSDKSANKLAASNAKPAPQGDNSVADVAALSTEPAKIPATAGPTAKPVAARVPSSHPSDATPSPSEDASASTASSTPNTATPDSKSRSKSRRGTKPDSNSEEASVAHPADPTSDGERSLVRALGLKVGRIVIDPGHGGHDSGTLGPGGIEEKDVVLDVALRVGRLLHDQLGAEIVYTRDTDTFIPLETRTAIANKAQADLFLSIHANSSPEPDARGVEAYYLNFTSDPTALDVAARENAVSTSGVHQLSDLVRKIALKDKIDESREFAADIDTGLYDGLRKGNPGLKDRGVKKAPFVVLIGAQMPSVLAEISFLTNPDDAEQLREPEYRERIAKSLVDGVERYLRGLSGTRPHASDKALASTPSTGNGSGQ